MIISLWGARASQVVIGFTSDFSIRYPWPSSLSQHHIPINLHHIREGILLQTGIRIAITPLQDFICAIAKRYNKRGQKSPTIQTLAKRRYLLSLMAAHVLKELIAIIRRLLADDHP